MTQKEIKKDIDNTINNMFTDYRFSMSFIQDLTSDACSHILTAILVRLFSGGCKLQELQKIIEQSYSTYESNILKGKDSISNYDEK